MNPADTDQVISTLVAELKIHREIKIAMQGELEKVVMLAMPGDTTSVRQCNTGDAVSAVRALKNERDGLQKHNEELLRQIGAMRNEYERRLVVANCRRRNPKRKS
jgi:hypothetical protein